MQPQTRLALLDASQRCDGTAPAEGLALLVQSWLGKL
jgi:hypothetical protein